MTCNVVIERLSDLVGGEVDAATATELTQHLAGCAGCAARRDEMRAVVSLLRRAGSVTPPSGFPAVLHQRLVAAGAPERPLLLRRLRAEAFVAPLGWACAGAAVALCAVALFGGQGRPGTSPAPSLAVIAPSEATQAGPVSPTYHVPASKLAVVRIDFVADTPADDVAFAVNLPDGLRFVSGGRELDERAFRWRGPLALGSNPIPFTVRGAKAGRYTIRAEAVGGGVAAEHEVVLEVTSG